jgi:hypothetical protein
LVYCSCCEKIDFSSSYITLAKYGTDHDGK